MTSKRRTIVRRSFLKSASAGVGAVLAASAGWGKAAPPSPAVSAEHDRAVNRRRRIVVQYDAQGLYDLDFAAWLDYRFRYIDEPGTQIDSIWWDMGRLGQVLYPSKFLDQLSCPGLDKWRKQGIDLVGRLVEETKRRKLEVFWHHRVSEVDIDRQGRGAAWKDAPVPLKQAHPDWVLKTWWRHGLWNFAVPAVRAHTVQTLQEVVQRYDFDGVQLDFARHVPCLPPGRQWELRHHVTELMRSVRRMLFQRAQQRGRPLLLAAKVPQTLAGCRADGFDVEVWAQENLVDIFTLGSRSIEVDLAAFRRITAGRNIKLQPCFDDHHTTDGYRSPPIEVFRGAFGNWWQQGADSVVTFNWSNAPPEIAARLGDLPGPQSQRVAYHEVGSPQTLQFKDKTFVVERRGGYPWAEGFFNRNDTAPLPLALDRGGAAAAVRVRVGDDLAASAGRVREVILRIVLFGAEDDAQLDVRLSGHVLPLVLRDPAWKDPQIFSPRPQPASGGSGAYKVNPRQRLLRLEFAVNPELCRRGENQVDVRVVPRPGGTPDAKAVLEKLEAHVRYA
jgi:hypothetical protein